MDRRKLMAKNTGGALHQNLQSLHSSSQFINRVSSLESAKQASKLSKSSSADGNILAQSTKRKNCELSDSDSPTKLSSIRKKRRDRDNDDNDVDQEKKSLERSLSPPLSGNRFLRPSNRQNKVNNSTKREEKGGGSYIKGVLEAIDDRSLSQLSQCSTSSVDKYRKANIRTPLFSRFKKPSVSKTLSQRVNEKASASQQSQALLNQSLNKSTLSKHGSSQTSTPEKTQEEAIPKNDEITLKKKNSSKRDCVVVLSDTSDSENEKEMSFSDADSDSPTKTDKENKISKKLTTKTRAKEDSTPTKSQTTPVKSQRSRILDSPELSPLKSLENLELSNENIERRLSDVQINCKFSEFAKSVGITLYSGDNFHICNADGPTIVQRVKDLLISNNLSVNEILEFWKLYIEDRDNLIKSVMEMKMETDEGPIIGLSALTVANILLRVPQLQTLVLKSLFQKLIDAVTTT